MNPAHLHLLTNHLPVLGTLFGLCLLLFAQIRKSDELKKVSFGVFFLVALLSIPSYVSGEPAEEQVENIATVSKVFLEQHEDAAKVAFVGVLVLGALGLVGLLRYRFGKCACKWFSPVVIVAALVVTATMMWTANLGGKIRHSEIRGGNGTAVSQAAAHHKSH